jgi:hypothetical protein
MLNIKNIITIITVLLFLSFITSCSNLKGNRSDADEIVFDDDLDFKKTDVSLNNTIDQGILPGSFSGSKTSVMTDGFGNKTEMKCFNNHLRLLCVSVKTSADGTVEVTAIGQNGERNPVPKQMQDRVLTASPDEIANAAGITRERQFNSGDKIPSPGNAKDYDYPPLQPLTSDNFPSRRQEDQIEYPPPQQQPPDQPVEDDSDPEAN